MRIISPIDSLEEAEQLLKAGVDELYGGYLPPEWSDYGLSASLNQRTFESAQIATEDDLAEIISRAHDRGACFALTLNAPFYTDDQFPVLQDYVAKMVRLGVDSLILADPGLLRLLKMRHPRLEYHASTLAHLTNSGAIRFMAGQGFDRFVLPRHLTVSDMKAIAAQVPDIRCDAFLLVGKCPNSEGLCSFHHSSPDKIWPCEIPYEINPVSSPPSEVLRQAMSRQDGWSKTNRRHGCGLCAIPALREAGIHGLKLVGRGAPVKQKVRNITLAREFIDLAGSCIDFSDYRLRAMKAHKERFGADCHQNVCYYPEFFYGGDL